MSTHMYPDMFLFSYFRIFVFHVFVPLVFLIFLIFHVFYSHVFLVFSSGFAANSGNYDTNLFINGNFELASVATGYVIGWSCQGHEQEFIPMYRNIKLVQSGSFSGVCVKRQTRTDGPGQFIGM